MKVAFASEHPADEIGAFSGIPYFMSHALRAACESFVYIQTPGYDFDAVRYDREKGLQDLKRTGNYLSDRLKGLDVDVVVCQGSSMIPFLKTDKPVVLWHDATWLALMQTDVETLKQDYPLLYEWDQRVLETCDLIAFAADWVREQTRMGYRVPPHKMMTLPFGANIKTIDQEKVKRAIDARTSSPCQLTFLGVDWRRKGLEAAYQVCRKLNLDGLATKLNVIGCHVDRVGFRRRLKQILGQQPFTETEKFQLNFWQDPTVNDLGFLKKCDPTEYATICEVLSQSHFLLHPASFECFGIALVEANAFGVPVIATDQYGPQTIIRKGSNGWLFPAAEYVEATTTLIHEFMADPERYRDFAWRSFIEQQSRLDWNRSVQKLQHALVNLGLVASQAGPTTPI